MHERRGKVAYRPFCFLFPMYLGTLKEIAERESFLEVFPLGLFFMYLGRTKIPEREITLIEKTFGREIMIPEVFSVPP